MGDLDLVQSEECLGRLDLRKILEVTLRGVVYKLKASCRLVLGAFDILCRYSVHKSEFPH